MTNEARTRKTPKSTCTLVSNSTHISLPTNPLSVILRSERDGLPSAHAQNLCPSLCSG